MNAALRTRRSLLVSWLLGASVVAFVTFSFEALSAREAAPDRCLVTGEIASCAAKASSSRPARPRTEVRTEARCPAWATAVPAMQLGRCPAAGTAPRARPAGPSV